MIGGKNPNHYSYYNDVEKKKEVKVEIKDEIKDEVVIEKQDITKDYLYSMSKAEQVFALKEIGLSSQEIKQLKKEKDRVEKLYELLN
jgi:hypothetical protein